MKSILFVCILSVFPIIAQSQNSGFNFLKQAPNTAAIGISGASTATPQGAASSYMNPALLSLNTSSTIDLSYSHWIDDTNYLFGGINFVKGNRAISFGVYNNSSSGFEQRNNPGDPNGEFSVNYLSLSGAIAYDFNYFSIGATAQYLNEDSYIYQANGFAFNLGIATSFAEDKIRAGLSVINLGEMEELNETASALPKELRTGVAFDLFSYTHPKSPDLPIELSASLDFVHPLESDSNNNGSDVVNELPDYFNMSIQFLIAESVQLTGGYRTDDSARSTSFGAGFLLDQLSVHYALVPYELGFGTLHSIGLQYKF
ncbi:PorV/PorQ family protein [Balneola vulgaris]|uniref:PorV/PorQ family protein n=1 Tax=Balneola vulgaris TaxID=287535 RepID=UPI000367396E|nr:PorV/PorQ family protein [Balneola vulgaris]